MDYSQLFALILFIPVALQILLPLLMLAGFAFLRLAAPLFSDLVGKKEQGQLVDKEDGLRLDRA